MENQTYDYIVVGAGSAGCVLANRLTERGGHRVLLVEAGSHSSSLMIRAPALYNLLWRTKFDWNLYTEPQEHVDGRRMYWPRGKVVGGTSCLNAMVYIRGHRSNYDEWRDLGCAGWGYSDVLPLFKKSEDYRGPASDYHGRGGPLTVSVGEPTTRVSEAFIEAAMRATGARRNSDFNGAEQEGFGTYHHTVRDGVRWSTAEAFLRPALARPELEVASDATVTRIVLENGRAIGIEIVRDGETRVIRAAREIVLAAGAIGSPQILLLSGVGPADHLRERGIEVKHELRGVGENLQDHLLTILGCRALSKSALYLSLANLALWAARYALNGGGPLRVSPVDVGGFLRTSAGAGRPDLQFHFTPWGVDSPNTDEKRSPNTGRRFSICPSLIYPKSRGSLRLRTNNPTDAPAIDPRYFSEPEDLGARQRRSARTRDRRDPAAR